MDDIGGNNKDTYSYSFQGIDYLDNNKGISCYIISINYNNKA